MARRSKLTLPRKTDATLPRSADAVAADATVTSFSAADTVVPSSSCTGAATTPELEEVMCKQEVDESAVAITQEIAPIILPLSTPLSNWQICGDAVIGLAHRRKGLPCQDAVAIRNSPRPILALSDGAGSAAISERGAQALVIGIPRFLRTMENDLSSWLDSDDQASQLHAARWAEKLLLHAQGLLKDLSESERRDVRDVRATLQVAVFGTRYVFWWKVGDGAIVARNFEQMWALGNQANAKGEFANQTCFVDTAKSTGMQFGLLPTSDTLGIAMMSDGGAEKLVSHDGSKVANRLGGWLDEVAEQKFAIDRIALAFHEPAMWERTTLDDRSLILAARTKPSLPATNEESS